MPPPHSVRAACRRRRRWRRTRRRVRVASDSAHCADDARIRRASAPRPPAATRADRRARARTDRSRKRSPSVPRRVEPAGAPPRRRCRQRARRSSTARASASSKPCFVASRVAAKPKPWPGTATRMPTPASRVHSMPSTLPPLTRSCSDVRSTQRASTYSQPAGGLAASSRRSVEWRQPLAPLAGVTPSRSTMKISVALPGIGGSPLRAVAERRRDDQLAPPADAHPDEALVPALDHGARAERSGSVNVVLRSSTTRRTPCRCCTARRRS